MQETLLEIRPMYEADDFGEAFTPELRAQEDRFRVETQRDAFAAVKTLVVQYRFFSRDSVIFDEARLRDWRRIGPEVDYV